jgi:hypothetical protein
MDSVDFVKKAKELGWIIYPYPSIKKYEEYFKEVYKPRIERLSKKTASMLFILSSNHKFFNRIDDYIQEASIELFKEYKKEPKQLLEMFAFYKKRNDRILIFDWAVKNGLAISHDFKKKELIYHYFDYFLNFKKYLTGACRYAINRYNIKMRLEDRNTVLFNDLKKNSILAGAPEDENNSDQGFMDSFYNTRTSGNKANIFSNYYKIDRLEDFIVKKVLVKNLFKKLDKHTKEIIILHLSDYGNATEIFNKIKISNKTYYEKLHKLKENHSEDILEIFEEKNDTIPYFNRPCSKKFFERHCIICDKKIKDEVLIELYFKNENYDKKKYCSLECSKVRKKQQHILKEKIKEHGDKFINWLSEGEIKEDDFNGHELEIDKNIF